MFPAEAEATILASVPALPAEDCLLLSAAGRILRSPVRADRDLPPFDRVTMDGFAFRLGAKPAFVSHEFNIVGFQAAGMIAQTIKLDTDTIEIATGAVLPNGADTVVPYEDVTRTETKMSLATNAPISVGQNIHRRASDHRAGETLLNPGTKLTGREIAVAAACGTTTVRVSVQPRIAVVATGDELAEIEAQSIAPHQIRRSNDHALRAGLINAGYQRVERFHFHDVRDEIVQGLRRLLLEFDVIILTGGVSKGKLDYLPGALEELNVRKKFQGVAQRPGKPLWFGISNRNTPVFALPGNPVSTYTCFSRYVLPALKKMSGEAPPAVMYAVLKSALSFKAPLVHFVPVKLETTPAGQLQATPAVTNTSGDFAGLVGTDGFVELPAGPIDLAAGTVVRFFPWS
ncbi:MAG TPA: molybdopterin molybdotransferase MoeA [Opitutaceae bacterium]|nr:molybdopterin molybdotransferase MoeA [Opitutaceae bacterium]